MKKGSLNNSQPTKNQKTAQNILETFEKRKIVQNRKNAEDE